MFSCRSFLPIGQSPIDSPPTTSTTSSTVPPANWPALPTTTLVHPPNVLRSVLARKLKMEHFTPPLSEAKQERKQYLHMSVCCLRQCCPPVRTDQIVFYQTSKGVLHDLCPNGFVLSFILYFWAIVNEFLDFSLNRWFWWITVVGSTGDRTSNRVV